ncbi:hypothetical protein [Kitasatospora sp. NPDC088351]|uniref:hypothetical protein n=1 Tax=unclassified Kitasatospora TaxID=2633591 RepID=UPI0034327F67
MVVGRGALGLGGGDGGDDLAQQGGRDGAVQGGLEGGQVGRVGVLGDAFVCEQRGDKVPRQWFSSSFRRTPESL